MDKIMKFVKGFIMSLGMFSIIPVPKNSWDDKHMHLVMPALPLVGALIGLVWYGLSVVMSTLSVPPVINCAVILFIPFFLSGFVHLDGYMDTADAVFSRRRLIEKKRILKDPHTGAFAVIALAGLFIFQFGAVYTIIGELKSLLIFVFIPVLSRCVACIAALNMKPVFEDGYHASFKSGTKQWHTVFICLLLLICYAVACIISGTAALPLLIGAAAGALTILYLYIQFGGMSGDLCGCIIAVTELAALLGMALMSR